MTQVLKLPGVRLAFPQIWTAAQVNGQGNPRFGASLLIPKASKLVTEIEKGMKAVAQEKWGAKGEAQFKALLAGDKTCLHDGNLKDYDGFEEHMYVSAANKVKPRIVDRDNSELNETDGRPYAGCYVNASLEFWAQDNQFGKRINASLRGLQFVKDGDAFSAGAPASEDEFDDLGDKGEDTDVGV